MLDAQELKIDRPLTDEVVLFGVARFTPASESATQFPLPCRTLQLTPLETSCRFAAQAQDPGGTDCREIVVAQSTGRSRGARWR